MRFSGPLEQLATAFGLALLLFVATNIDDVFILLALFSDPSFRPAEVVAGQLLGMAVLLALSVAGALLAVVIAPGYVGLLGIVPLAFGILQLIRKHEDVSGMPAPAAARSALRVLAVSAITIANGADNIGVYIPMFATANRLQLAVYAVTMLASTAALCWLAHALIHHPRLGAPIRRFAESATPFILIALGVYILLESRAYTIFSS
jgi:cadmium resistance protein CadD (predicted permease)